jgi:hypothetical protein
MLNELLFRFFLTLFPGVAGIGDAPPAPQPTVVRAEPNERVDSARVAQVRLAETLATAEAIHSVRAKSKANAKDNAVTFTITRGDTMLAVTATTKRGEVVALDIVPATNVELGTGLSWLADEMESITAVTKIVPDADGAVTLTTNDGRRYQLIPGRGSGGNDAVSSRWAGEWDRS